MLLVIFLVVDFNTIKTVDNGAELSEETDGMADQLFQYSITS